MGMHKTIITDEGLVYLEVKCSAPSHNFSINKKELRQFLRSAGRQAQIRFINVTQSHNLNKFVSMADVFDEKGNCLVGFQTEYPNDVEYLLIKQAQVLRLSTKLKDEQYMQGNLSI